MKKILFALLFLPLFAGAQIDLTIDKGSGWLYFSGIPGTTPNVAAGSEIAVNVLANEAYVWNRDSTRWDKWLSIDSVYTVVDTLYIRQGVDVWSVTLPDGEGTLAANGLTLDGVTVKLGGALTEPTNITGTAPLRVQNPMLLNATTGTPLYALEITENSVGSNGIFLNNSNTGGATQISFSESGAGSATWGAFIQRLNSTNARSRTLEIFTSDAGPISLGTNDTRRMLISGTTGQLTLDGYGTWASFQSDTTSRIAALTPTGEVVWRAASTLGGAGQTLAMSNDTLTISGGNSIRLLTDAKENTKGGFGALLAPTGVSAVYNTAFGFEALNALTNSFQNVAIGHSALVNATAESNVAVGAFSATGMTTGIRNVAVGTNSLSGNSTGSYNVALGHDAMIQGSKSFSVGIGFAAGYFATGDSSTFIGTNAGPATGWSTAKKAQGSRLYLHNNVGIPTIYAEFDQKNVAIADTVANATLDVNGNFIVRTTTQNDTLTKIAALDYTTGLLHWRNASTLAGAGTDDQNLSVGAGTATTSIIEIENGTGVTLEAGTNITLTEDVGTSTITIAATGGGTDDQTLSTSRDTITIETGNSVRTPGVGFIRDSITTTTLTVDLKNYNQAIISLKMTSATTLTLTVNNPWSDVSGAYPSQEGETGVYTFRFWGISGTDAVTWPATFYTMNDVALGTQNYTTGTAVTCFYDPVEAKYFCK